MNYLSPIIGIAIAAGLAVPSLAQTAKPEAQRCFTVTPLANGAPTSALLVDKCTGKTWALSVVLGAASKEFAPYKWVPIEVGATRSSIPR